MWNLEGHIRNCLQAMLLNSHHFIHDALVIILHVTIRYKLFIFVLATIINLMSYFCSQLLIRNW
jgi:hypothetical protein